MAQKSDFAENNKNKQNKHCVISEGEIEAVQKECELAINLLMTSDLTPNECDCECVVLRCHIMIIIELANNKKTNVKNCDS